VIAAIGGPAQALAAKAATSTIPIVFQVGVDPTEIELITSLGRPGGNITGVTSLNLEVGPKRLEVMHELVPTVTTMALLINPTRPTLADNESKSLPAVARTLGLELHVLQASNESDFDAVFKSIMELQARALIISPDAFLTVRSGRLAALALRHGLPSISPYREFVVAGGLMSSGGNITESWRAAGVYTGRVLKGEKPADLPVQQSTKVELIINLNAAKALGLTVPIPLLGRADEVIE
jgi:putative ABC transport system substrate-binding protein